MDIEPTQYAGHAVALARKAAADGYRLVLAAGGDGTLGEIANGLAHSQTIMGPLPVGTGNSFAKELRLPRPGYVDHRGLVEAAALLASGRVQQMDLGQCNNNHYWLLWAGVGVDSYLVRRIEPRSKMTKRLGPLGYALQTFFFLPFFPGLTATIELDGKRVEGDYLLILVSNCRLFAGGELLLNPSAALDDGKFEVWLFPGKGISLALRYVSQVARHQHHQNPAIQKLTGRNLTIHTRPNFPYQTDGDPAGQTPLTCQIVPAALQVLIPPTAPAGLFSRPGTPL